MWAKVYEVCKQKSVVFCVAESNKKFIFGLKQVPDVQVGDIVQFRTHKSEKVLPPRPDGRPRTTYDEAEEVEIIGYSILETAEPSQAVPAVAAQISDKEHVDAGIQNSPRRAA